MFATITDRPPVTIPPCHHRPVQAESLLNVSYDPTRELYRELNEAFAAFWVARAMRRPTIEASHGGSGARPAR
jgi:ABC-type sulfate transport system substrate-binding protein